MDKNIGDAFARGLHGMWSHPDPLDVIDKVDFETVGMKVEGYPLTIWQISRHMMEWGWMIFNKLRKVELPYEADQKNFFPAETSSSTAAVWQAHKNAFRELILQCEDFIPTMDPNATYPEWDDSTATDLLMILISHNSYHTAQIVAILKMLGKWDPAPEEIPFGS